MNPVDRAKNILLQPKEEWPVIVAEPQTVQDLYTRYAMILAAIPAIASFIGLSLVGIGGYRVPIAGGIAHMVLTYALSLGGVYVLALIIDWLAPNFGGAKDFMRALKLAVFSMTAAWLAGIFNILPQLSVLSLLGLYSLYLLYTGLPLLMSTQDDKALPYTVVVIVAALVIGVVVAAIASLAVPGAVRGF